MGIWGTYRDFVTRTLNVVAFENLVQDLGFGVCGLEFRVPGLGLNVHILDFEY